MTPIIFLSLLGSITFIAAVGEALHRRRHGAKLRAMAMAWDMRFAACDPFRLCDRVAQDFPCPGAAFVKVSNLIYGLEAGSRRFYFTAEYTAGVLRWKKRVRRAATYLEPNTTSNDQRLRIELADENLPIDAQYLQLRDRTTPATAAASAAENSPQAPRESASVQ